MRTPGNQSIRRRRINPDGLLDPNGGRCAVVHVTPLVQTEHAGPDARFPASPSEMPLPPGGLSRTHAGHRLTELYHTYFRACQLQIVLQKNITDIGTTRSHVRNRPKIPAILPQTPDNCEDGKTLRVRMRVRWSSRAGFAADRLHGPVVGSVWARSDTTRPKHSKATIDRPQIGELETGNGKLATGNYARDTTPLRCPVNRTANPTWWPSPPSSNSARMIMPWRRTTCSPSGPRSRVLSRKM